MKRLFLIICALLISACSQSDKDRHLIDCERAGLINKSIRMALQADKANDTQMKNLAICFVAEVYNADDNSLKEILNSEEKEQNFMLKKLRFCQAKLQNITPEEFNTMAEKALMASEFSKGQSSCFE